MVAAGHVHVRLRKIGRPGCVCASIGVSHVEGEGFGGILPRTVVATGKDDGAAVTNGAIDLSQCIVAQIDVAVWQSWQFQLLKSGTLRWVKISRDINFGAKREGK